MIRAKFVVESVVLTVGQIQVSLRAVYTGEENKSWSKYTPAGSLIMTITNPAAFDKFVPGAEVYVDLSLVIKEAK